MRVVVVTAPAPVILVEEAKLRLGVERDDHDVMIAQMIAEATGHIDGPDGWLGRAIGVQTLEARFDGFGCGVLRLPYVTIPTAGSPPADGGGASPPGGYCITTDTPILMADRTTKLAGELATGDRLLTRHEERLERIGGGWGFYPVEAVEIADSGDVWLVTVGGRELRATGDHLVYTGLWTKMRDLPGAAHVAGTHQIVKMTVTGAHTYVSNGILSHNIKDVSGSE